MSNLKVAKRRCLACRKSATKDTLFRIVAGDDDSLKYDSLGDLPGRGVYLHRLLECVLRAPPGKVWAHALKIEHHRIGKDAVSNLVDELKELVDF